MTDSLLTRNPLMLMPNFKRYTALSLWLSSEARSLLLGHQRHRTQSEVRRVGGWRDVSWRRVSEVGSQYAEPISLWIGGSIDG